MKTEVKGTKKMKEVLKTAVMMLVIMLCILGLTEKAKAEIIRDDNGVEIKVTTDKSEYKLGETIKVEVIITNEGEDDIQNISYS